MQIKERLLEGLAQGLGIGIVLVAVVAGTLWYDETQRRHLWDVRAADLPIANAELVSVADRISGNSLVVSGEVKGVGDGPIEFLARVTVRDEAGVFLEHCETRCLRNQAREIVPFMAVCSLVESEEQYASYEVEFFELVKDDL